jgi:hypothetical protein
VIEFTSMWKGATDKGRWSARGASFMAKVKATKVVWFPPDPAKSGTKAVSKAANGAKKTTKTAARTTGKANSKTAKKTTKKATGAAKKATSGSRS